MVSMVFVGGAQGLRGPSRARLTRYLFRHSHGGTGFASFHTPILVAASLLPGPRHQPQFRASPAGAIAEPLSGRECDILHLIAQGRIDKEIARMLSISPETVKSHVKSIFIKLNAQKRARAVSRALSLGLIGTPRPDPIQ